MATYVPGSKSYLPEVKAFTPDYKFLSNVLQTRTDRYTTNYDALSDLYGKVVYADLSRQDTNGTRTQYVNDIAPKIEQISGLDLSLQQNVDAAKGVFSPFFQDDLVVKDMIVTKQYRNEMNYAQSLLESPNDKQVEKYWETGIKALNYQMQDFIDADRGAALQMGIPKYVEDVDLYEKSLSLLNESGLFDEEIYGPPEFSPDGKWIIKTKGGGIVSQQALVFLQRSLVDNPEVQRAYYTSAYVEQRDATKNMVESGAAPDLESAKRLWATQTLAKAEEQLAQEISETEDQIAVEEIQLNSQKEYVEKYGDFALTEKGSAMAVAISDLEAQKEHLNDKATQLKANGAFIETEPDVSTDALLNRAYNMMMNVNIGGDLAAAAHTFGQSKLQVDIEVNEYKRDEIKAQQARSLENLRHTNALAEINRKAELDEEAAGAGAANPFGGPGGQYDVREADGVVIIEPESLMNDNKLAVADAHVEVETEKLDFLLEEKVYLSNDGNKIVVSVVDDNLNVTGEKVLSRDEARQYYSNNPGAFANDYVAFKDMITNQNSTEAQKYKGYFDVKSNQSGNYRYSDALDKIEGFETRTNDIEYAEQQHLAVAWNNLENLTAEETGETDENGRSTGKRASEDLYVLRNLEGYPSPIERIKNPDGTYTYRELTKEEYETKVFNMTLADDNAIREYDVQLTGRGFKWVDVGSLQSRLMKQQGTGVREGFAAINADPEVQRLEAEVERANDDAFKRNQATGFNMTREERYENNAEVRELNDQLNARKSQMRNQGMQTAVERKVREEAGEVYDKLYESMGEAFVKYSDAVESAGGEGSTVDSPYGIFDVEKALAGQDYNQGSSMYIPGIQGTFNAQNPPPENSPVFNLVSEYYNIMSGLPNQQVYVHAGDVDQGTKTSNLQDETGPTSVLSQKVLNQIALDSKAWISRGTEAAQPSDKAPNFDITRQDTWTDNDGNEYIKYKFDIGNDYLKSLAGDDNLIPKLSAATYSTISVIVPKDAAQPFLSPSLDMRESSAAMRQLNLRGTIDYDIADGGSYSITKSSDNKITMNESFQIFDLDTWRSTGQLKTVPMEVQYINDFIALDQTIKETRQVYSQLSTNNRTQMELYKDEQGSINPGS
jgi:hypothetical protein